MIEVRGMSYALCVCLVIIIIMRSNNNCKVSTAASCASVSGANTYVLQHVRNVAMKPVEVCKSALHDPSYKRTIGPANSSNTKVRDFIADS